MSATTPRPGSASGPHWTFFLLLIVTVSWLAVPMTSARAGDCELIWGSSLTLGPSGWDLVIADFNADGVLDVATTGDLSRVDVYQCHAGTLSSSSFVQTQSISLAGQPTGIAAADFNGDGITDLVTANYYGTITFLLGQGSEGVGDGTFGNPSSLAVGVHPFDVVAADFDQDGRIDLAVSDQDCASGGVYILLGLPSVTPGVPNFAAPTMVLAGCTVPNLAAGDFNGDNLPDLVVPFRGANLVQVLLGTGGGAFDATTLSASLVAPMRVQADDIDGDGIQDIAVGSQSGLWVYWGQGVAGVGDGTFLGGQQLTTLLTDACAIGDQDHDGVPDIVGATNTYDGVFRLLQTSPRVFAMGPEELPYFTASVVALADFDSNGYSDLLVSTNQFPLYLVPGYCLQDLPPPPPPSPVPGAWAEDGVPVAPSESQQSGEIILPDGMGGIFAVWVDGPLPGGGAVRVQRLSSTGDRLWGPTGAAVSDDPRDKRVPWAIPDGAGGLYVTWTLEPARLKQRYVQRLASNGAIAPGWPAHGISLSPVPEDNPYQPGWMALDDQGGVYVTTIELPDGGYPTARLFRFTGMGDIAPGWSADGLVIGSFSGGGYYSYTPSAAAILRNGSGGVSLILTTDNHYTDPPGYSTSSVAYSLDSNGVASGAQFGVLDYSGYPRLFELPGGEGLLTYVSDSGSGPLPRAIRMNAAAQAQWSVTLGTVTPFISPLAVGDGFGGFFTIWDGGTSTARDLYGNHVGPSGAIDPAWPAASLDLTLHPATQQQPWIANDGMGGFLMLWCDDRSGILDAFYSPRDANGQPRSGTPEFGTPIVTTAGAHTAPLAVVTEPGLAIVTWLDRRSGVNQLYANQLVFSPPVATTASLQSLEAAPGRVHVVWSLGEAVASLRVDRSSDGVAWSAVGVAQPSGEREVEWTDMDVAAGQRLRYRLVDPVTGEVLSGSEVLAEIPAALEFALQGFESNPTGSDASVRFTLSRRGEARLSIYDVSGREVFAREVGDLGPGRQRVSVASASLPPGFYVLQLRQGAERRTARGLVVR